MAETDVIENDNQSSEENEESSSIDFNKYFENVGTVKPKDPPEFDIPDDLREIIKGYKDKAPQNPIENSRAEDPTDAIFGYTPDGEIYKKRLSKAPHALVAGTTGSGKSVMINFTLITMMVHSTPDQLKFAIIDPKMNEFSQYRGNPYMLADPITDMRDADAFITYLTILMDQRYQVMEGLGLRNIDAYNAWAEKNGEEKWASVVTVVDEFSDLIGQNKDIEKPIIRIGQKARAAGIHLILATQSPRAEVVTGLIKANLPTKICMKVATSTESQIMLDETGGEDLRGYGDMWIKFNGGNKERVQGGYIPDEQQNAVLEAVRMYYETKPYPDYKQVVENYYLDNPKMAPRDFQKKMREKERGDGGVGAGAGRTGGVTRLSAKDKEKSKPFSKLKSDTNTSTDSKTATTREKTTIAMTNNLSKSDNDAYVNDEMRKKNTAAKMRALRKEKSHDKPKTYEEKLEANNPMDKIGALFPDDYAEQTTDEVVEQQHLNVSNENTMGDNDTTKEVADTTQTPMNTTKPSDIVEQEKTQIEVEQKADETVVQKEIPLKTATETVESDIETQAESISLDDAQTTAKRKSSEEKVVQKEMLLHNDTQKETKPKLRKVVLKKKKTGRDS